MIQAINVRNEMGNITTALETLKGKQRNIMNKFMPIHMTIEMKLKISWKSWISKAHSNGIDYPNSSIKEIKFVINKLSTKKTISSREHHWR